MLRSFLSVVLIGIAIGVAVLGGLALFSAAGEDGGEKGAAAAGEDGDGAEKDKGAHPEGEVLMFKFREMFDYQGSGRVGDEASAPGITPIVTAAFGKGPIPLAQLLVLSEKIERSVDYLADGTTQMEQAVGWFLYDGRLHYVLLIRPYEQGAHELMKRPGEDLFVSFVNGKNERMVPRSAPERIGTSDLRVAVTSTGQPAGWVTYGELPMQDAVAKDLKEPKVGWIFSGTLHARLQRLQRAQMVREQSVSDPFALDFEAAGKAQ